MTFPFPTEYVDKEDPAYQNSPRFQTILKPGKRGSRINDYLRTANDLEAALDSKILSESTPHIPASGRELSLGLLREEVGEIIARNDVEWVRGCDSLLIRHHPVKRERLLSILSVLLSAPRPNDYSKLLSVRHKGEIFVFKVVLHEDEYMRKDSVLIIPVNRTDPAVVRLAEKDRTGGVRFSHLYGSKEVMECFALNSLRLDLCSRRGILLVDLEYGYEPLGKNSFPDFKLLIDDEKWAVEVARVESGMVSYVEVERQLDAKGRNLAFRNRITDERVGDALRSEIGDKAKKRADCAAYSRFCLLLVDVVDSIGGGESTVWNGCDLSAFDAVVTVRLDGSVSYIKGGTCLGLVSVDPNEQ